MASRYDYEELRAAAKSGNQEDINALGEWLNQFGRDFWNGEVYDADGICLRPTVEFDENDCGTVVGYEVV